MFKGLISGLLFSVSLIAQINNVQTNAVVGAGYSSPAPVSVAPGQLLTFFVDGLSISQPVRAPSGALPLSLAGVTATLRQASNLPVPILDVRPLSGCPDLVGINIAGLPACTALTAVTVQLPYELIPLCPLCLRPTLLPAQLFFTANGHDGAAIELNALADQVHILTSCDVMLAQAGMPNPLNTTGLPCAPMVTHSDGTLVSASKPANVGEELTAWAVGLGPVNPPATTGQPAPAAAVTTQTYSLDFNYSVNALPLKPYTGRPNVKPPQALFAGLTGGFVGLYQVNFVVPPEPPNGTPHCSPPGTFAPGANVPQSNLTVSIGGGFSFDGAGICVATRIPID